MSKFAFMVHVETVKDYGLIASRDEQTDRIIQALENVASEVDIDGIGARGDSSYSVEQVDVWIMDKKSEREANEEYEQMVLEAAPPKDELLAELIQVRAQAEKYERLYETQKAIVDQIIADNPLADSPVYQEDRNWDLPVEQRKVPINPRDHIYFQFGEHRSDRLSVKFSNYDDGSIEVAADTMGREFAVLPQSGNVVRIKVIDR